MMATCQMGDDSYTLVAQRHTRIWRTLPEVLAQAGDLGDAELTDAASIVVALGDRVYDVLAVFIPDLMPRWKFQGFASEEAMQAGAYNPQADRAPTVPEIIDAFEVAWQVNGLSRVAKTMGKLLGPDLVAPIRTLIAANVTQSLNSPSSPTSASANGASDSTSSTASSPTTPESLSA